MEWKCRFCGQRRCFIPQSMYIYICNIIYIYIHMVVYKFVSELALGTFIDRRDGRQLIYRHFRQIRPRTAATQPTSRYGGKAPPEDAGRNNGTLCFLRTWFALVTLVFSCNKIGYRNMWLLFAWSSGLRIHLGLNCCFSLLAELECC